MPPSSSASYSPSTSTPSSRSSSLAASVPTSTTPMTTPSRSPSPPRRQSSKGNLFKTASSRPAHDIENSKNKIPVVRVPTTSISHALAARLAMCVVGHTLFLKGQVPFPVTQLARIPSSNKTQAHIRAAKKRTELLTALDTLFSHLHTTFRSLSWALALNEVLYPPTPVPLPSHPGVENEFANAKPVSRNKEVAKAKVHMMVLVGSSITMAKSRCVMELDGLEVVRLEEREEVDADESISGDDSFTVRTKSRAFVVLEEHEIVEVEGAPFPTMARHHQPGTQEVTIKAAERALSRTLACSSDFGAELPLTNTHILLRGPRRFSHPAWIPRQNYSSTFDDLLSTYLLGTADKKARAANVAEGVKVCPEADLEEMFQNMAIADECGCTRSANEEDELIWWQWDGKLAGIGDLF